MPILGISVLVITFAAIVVAIISAIEIDKAIKRNNQRLNLLSKENGRLYEENLHLKDKLKNLGFTEEKLK